MATVRIPLHRKVAYAHKVTRPYVHRTSELIMQGARRLAPRGDHRSGSGDPKPGLPLVTSLKMETKITIDEIRERVGSPNDYAASVHQGSQAHWIQSRGGKMLKFQWERGQLLIAARSRGRVRGRVPRSRGNFFYFVRVRHPGNKRPVRFLTTPLGVYGRMRGFRVTSTPASRSRLP